MMRAYDMNYASQTVNALADVFFDAQNVSEDKAVQTIHFDQVLVDRICELLVHGPSGSLDTLDSMDTPDYGEPALKRLLESISY